MRPRRPAPPLLLAALASLAPSVVRAYGPEPVPLSIEAALTADAVLAGDDPSGAGWYNPASLGGLTRSSVQLGASAYSVSGTRIGDALVTVLPWGTSSATASDTHYVSVPSVLSLSYRVREGLGLSLGVWTPYHNNFSTHIGGSSTGPYPGFPGLSATYQQTYSYSSWRDDTWAGIGAGWQVGPSLRLGASLQGAYASSSSTIDLDTGITTTSSDPLQQGAHLDVSVRGSQASLATRLLVGLQWDVVPALRLALTVRSPSLRIVTWGGTSRVTSLSVFLPGYAPQQAQLIEELEPSGGLTVTDASRVSGGGAWNHGPWSVRLEADWEPALPRPLASERASWNVRAGFLYVWDRDLTLGAGLFRDGARTRAADGTLSLDTYGLAGGVDYRPAKVVAALGGTDRWDLKTGVAVRLTYGTGKGPGMTIVPFDFASSVVPIFPGQGDGSFQEVPAQMLDGSIQFFTALSF